MSFTSLTLSAITDGGYAYLAYDLQYGFRLLEQRVDKNAVYFRDLSDLDADGVEDTAITTAAMVINSKLVDLTAPFSALENLAGTLIKVGDTWATILSYNSAQSLTIDNHPARLPPIQSITVGTPGTIRSPGHGMVNDTPVKFVAEGLVPGNITEGATYYTRNVTTDTYQISITSGGTPIQITSQGIGQVYPSLLYSVYLPSFDADKINDTIIGKIHRQGSTYSMETYFNVSGTSSTPLELVDGLPVAGNYEGQVVINTTDNLIYTWNGTNWVTGTGSESRSVKLATDKQAFQYTSAGTVSGVDTATITATPYNTAGTVTYGFKVDGGSYAQEGASNTFSYTARAAFDDMPDIIEVDLFDDGDLVANDLITLFGVQQGSDAITIIVSNEAHTIPSQADGSASVFTGSGTTIQVFKGATPIPYDDTVSYADPSFRVSAAATNVTAGAISGVDNTATIADLTAMTAVSGNLTLTITVVDETETEYTKIQSFAKSLAGADGSGGTNAVVVKLTSNDYSINYAATGITPSPANFTLTGTSQGIDTPFYTFRATDEAGSILQASSIDNTLVISSPTNYFSPPNNYWVGVSDTDGGSILAFDTITISAIKPGADGTAGLDAYTIVVFNEAHTLPASSTGVVSSYTGSGTTIEAYYGATKLTHTTSTPGAGQFKVTASGSNVTAGAVSTVSGNAVVANASSMSADIAIVTLAINLENLLSTNKFQTLTKSKQGATGADGTDGADGATGSTGAQARIAYAKLASASSFAGTPASYVITGDALLTGTRWGQSVTWSTSPVAISVNETLYQITGIYNPSTNQTTWYGPPYLSSLKVGSLSAISANMGTITAGTIQSGTTGQDRLIITPGLVTIYNSSNQLVLEMGILP